MKLRVDLMWPGGLRDEGDTGPPPEPEYDLSDAESGKLLGEQPFKSYQALEAHIAAHYPGAERWIPPPAPPEEAAKLERMLALLESGPSPDVFDRRFARSMLIAHLYQYGYPPAVVARIRAQLL